MDRWTTWPQAESALAGRVPPEDLGVLGQPADRLSNVQRLDRLPRPEKRRSSYRETVEWILPRAAGVPFCHEQYGRWRERYAELG